MSHWFRLCGAQTPPPSSPTELLNMFEGLQCFSSVKGSFSFTHIRGGIGGEEGEWVGVGLRVRWYSCSSEVCLVGPELYWLERKLTAEFWGPENLDERKLLKLMPTSALERRAAIQPSLPACTTQQPHILTENTPSYPSTQTQTQDIMHTCISSNPAHTPTDNTFWLPF